MSSKQPKPVIKQFDYMNYQDIRIPDYKVYKADGIKHINITRTMLATRGLKDPWERNEVWRYKDWPGFGKASWVTIGRGLKWAVPAMIGCVILDKLFGISDYEPTICDKHVVAYWRTQCFECEA